MPTKTSLRFVLVVSLAAVALLAVAAVAASTSAPSVVAPAPVTALGADGPRVAYAARSFRLWNRSTRSQIVFGRGPSWDESSTGTGVSAVSVAGRRTLWLHYTGGNIREWTLWTATTTSRKPRQIAFVTAEPEDPAPIVVGEGDASRGRSLLPYAVGRAVVALRENGTRAFRWSASARVTALAAKNAELAVAVDGGAVYVLDPAGRVLRSQSFGRTVDAVAISGRLLLAQSGRTLAVRGGGVNRIFELGAGVRLADVAGMRAVLVPHGRPPGSIRLLSLATGASSVVATGSAAQVEQGWLTVANGRRVVARRLAGLAND